MRLNVLRHVRDSMADSRRQNERSDDNGKGCIDSYEIEDLVLCNENVHMSVVSEVLKTKLRPRFIGSVTVVAKKGQAYTLRLPRKLRSHPVFYIVMIKTYRDSSHVDVMALTPWKVAVPLAVASK